MTAGHTTAPWLRRVVPTVVALGLALGPTPDVVAQRARPRAPPSPLLPVDIAWTTDLGGSPRHPPAYDGTHAYVPLRDGMLVALDLRTGLQVWSREQAADRSPVAADGIVITADGNRLVALRAADGERLWIRELDTTVTGPLLLSAGWLVAPLGAGELAAVRAFDGTELWRRALGAAPAVEPTVGGGRLYVPLDDGRVSVLTLETGDTVWERALNGTPRRILPLDAIFVGSTDNFLYRLALDDGAVQWFWRTGGDIVGAPSVDGARVYFASLDNILRALDRRSGVQRWRRPLSSRPTEGPIRFESVLIVAGLSPTIDLFDAETGQPAGRYVAPGELAAPPYPVPGAAAAEPRLVLVTGNGRALALTAAIGPPRLTLTFPPHPLLPHPPRRAVADLAAWYRPHRPSPPPVAHARRYAVQVGALGGASGATRVAAALRAQGYPAYVEAHRVSPGAALHRVRVGRRLGHGDAARLADTLAREARVLARVVATND